VSRISAQIFNQIAAKGITEARLTHYYVHREVFMRIESHSLSLSLSLSLSFSVLFAPRNGNAAGALLVC